MVNKTGTITLKVKWARTGQQGLTPLPLYYGDKTLKLHLGSGSFSQYDDPKHVVHPDLQRGFDTYGRL